MRRKNATSMQCSPPNLPFIYLHHEEHLTGVARQQGHLLRPVSGPDEVSGEPEQKRGLDDVDFAFPAKSFFEGFVTNQEHVFGNAFHVWTELN